MSEFIKVVCTDRGTHARLDFGSIVVADDGAVSTTTTRKAAAPTMPSQLTSIGKRIVVNADDHRDDYGDRPRWRWTCKVCQRDVVLSVESLERIARNYLAADRRVFDLSALPR